ncbi:MAG: HigA family addiction module antitoxin [Alphaproteobacteria bacterium]|jgi:addiction module HigA family antidote|nr:HigA family addiction module antitoxin [Rickettsiales bacterium]
MARKLKNIHPGEVLLEEFLKPLGLSQNAVAHAIAVPPRRINEICLGKRAITPDTALRLARYFSVSPQFWLGLQNDFDLEESSRRGSYQKLPVFVARAADNRTSLSTA